MQSDIVEYLLSGNHHNHFYSFMYFKENPSDALKKHNDRSLRKSSLFNY